MQPISLQTQAIPKPVGVVAGDWRIRLRQGSTITHSYIGATPMTTFQDVPNGTYTILAERMSSEGNTIGEEVSREFTVTDGETVDVPVAILVGGA